MYANHLDPWQQELVRAFDADMLRPPAADEPHNEKRLFQKLVAYSFPDNPKKRSTESLAEEFDLEPRSIRRMIVELNAKLDGYFGAGSPGSHSLYRIRIVHLPVGRPSKDLAESRNRVVFELNMNDGFEARRLWSPYLVGTAGAAVTPVCLVHSEPLTFIDVGSGAEIRHTGIASLEQLSEQAGTDELAAVIQRQLIQGRLLPKPGAPPAAERAALSAIRSFLVSEGVPVAVEAPGRLPSYGPLYDPRHLILFGCRSTNPAIAKLDRGGDVLSLDDRPLREKASGALYRTWLLLTRFPNPNASGRFVTVVEARHPRAFEALEIALTSPERLRQLLARQQVATDDVLPDAFQLLFSIEINDRDELAGDGNPTAVERRGFPGSLRRPPDRVIPMRPAPNKKGAGG